MKAVLEFALPEQHEEHREALAGSSLCAAIQAVDQRCRDWLKHGHDFKTADEALVKVRDVIREELADYDLDWVMR